MNNIQELEIISRNVLVAVFIMGLVLGGAIATAVITYTEKQKVKVRRWITIIF